MADYQERIEAELEQVHQTLENLPDCPLSQLTKLELSGVGGILQSFYNGIENILKQVFRKHGIAIPEEVQWHRQLVEGAVQHGFISQRTREALIPYLTFRHLYRNAYVLDLKPDRMQALTDAIKNTFSEFKKDVR